MSSYCCAGMFGKRTLLLFVSSVLMASLAWAAAPAPSGGLFTDSGGGCRLPDLTGLSRSRSRLRPWRRGCKWLRP